MLGLSRCGRCLTCVGLVCLFDDARLYFFGQRVARSLHRWKTRDERQRSKHQRKFEGAKGDHKRCVLLCADNRVDMKLCDILFEYVFLCQLAVLVDECLVVFEFWEVEGEAVVEDVPCLIEDVSRHAHWTGDNAPHRVHERVELIAYIQQEKCSHCDEMPGVRGGPIARKFGELIQHETCDDTACGQEQAAFCVGELDPFLCVRDDLL